MLYKICFLLFFSGAYCLLFAKEYRVVKNVSYKEIVKFETETESFSRCQARIDFVEGLVEVFGDCDVKRIDCFTEDGMWLGTVVQRSYKVETELWWGSPIPIPTPKLEERKNFTKGYTYKNVAFYEFRSSTNLVEVVFDINECGHDYEYVDGRCVKIPEHSHLSRSGNWKCDYGYKLDGSSCKELAVCSSEQYKVSDFECENLPEHAHALAGGEKGWECDSGYHLETVREFEICKEDPIFDNLSAEIAGSLGTGGAGFAFDGELGLEWLFGKKINLGPAVTMGLVYSSHEDDFNLSFLSTRLNLAFVLASKLDNIQFYLRPVVSINLGTNVELSGTDSVQASYSVPSSAAGIEFGIRFWESPKELDYALDIYLKFFSTIFQDTIVSDEKLILVGMRFIFL